MILEAALAPAWETALPGARVCPPWRARAAPTEAHRPKGEPRHLFSINKLKKVTNILCFKAFPPPQKDKSLGKSNPSAYSTKPPACSALFRMQKNLLDCRARYLNHKSSTKWYVRPTSPGERPCTRPRANRPGSHQLPPVLRRAGSGWDGARPPAADRHRHSPSRWLVLEIPSPSSCDIT